METTNNEGPGKIDKKSLHGAYVQDARKHHRLQREGVAKAMDIPWDDSDVNIRTGISGKHLLGIIAVLLAGLLGWRGIDRLSMPPVEPPAPAPSAVPLAEPQEFKVSFWAEDGTELVVEPEGTKK